MQVAFILLGAAFLSGILGYILYYRALIREEHDPKAVKPNRWSWLIWSLGMTVESLTYDAVSGDLVKSSLFLVSAGCCVLLTIAIWRRSKWEMPTITEFLCVSLSIIAVAIWLAFSLAWWAHLVALSAIPLGFFPTWRNAWRNPEQERNVAWLLWTLAYVLAIGIVVLRYETPEELPYAIVDGVCHFSVWALVWWRSGSLGARSR